jgi:hypothetical protein
LRRARSNPALPVIGFMHTLSTTWPRFSTGDEHCEPVKKLPTKKRGVITHSTTVGVRCHDNLLTMIDEYRRNEPDLPTRASALRRLAIMALKAMKLGIVKNL